MALPNRAYGTLPRALGAGVPVCEVLCRLMFVSFLLDSILWGWGRVPDDPVRAGLENGAIHSAGRTASTPFFFTMTTRNFAGLVALALRPTVCTSSGPS
jgi:hypothetical protein